MRGSAWHPSLEYREPGVAERATRKRAARVRAGSRSLQRAGPRSLGDRRGASNLYSGGPSAVKTPSYTSQGCSVCQAGGVAVVGGASPRGPSGVSPEYCVLSTGWWASSLDPLHLRTALLH